MGTWSHGNGGLLIGLLTYFGLFGVLWAFGCYCGLN